MQAVGQASFWTSGISGLGSLDGVRHGCLNSCPLSSEAHVWFPAHALARGPAGWAAPHAGKGRRRISLWSPAEPPVPPHTVPDAGRHCSDVFFRGQQPPFESRRGRGSYVYLLSDVLLHDQNPSRNTGFFSFLAVGQCKNWLWNVVKYTEVWGWPVFHGLLGGMCERLCSSDILYFFAYTLDRGTVLQMQ